MTDTLLQKLEEKMMLLLTEMENLRKENHRLKQENMTFKTEQVDQARKLQDLLSLLDSLDTTRLTQTASELNFVTEAQFA